MNYAHRPRRGIPLATGLCLCAILASPLAISQETVLDSVPTLETITSRLDLTPEQEAKLRPVFQKRVSELHQTQVLLNQATTTQQKDDVLRNAKQSGQDFNSQVENVLTPSQKHDWREIRAEVVEKVEDRAEDKPTSR